MLASSKLEAIPGYNSGKYNAPIKSSSRLFLIFLLSRWDRMTIYMSPIISSHIKIRTQPCVFRMGRQVGASFFLWALISNDGSAGATAIKNIYQYHVWHGESCQANEYDPD